MSTTMSCCGHNIGLKDLPCLEWKDWEVVVLTPAEASSLFSSRARAALFDNGLSTSLLDQAPDMTHARKIIATASDLQLNLSLSTPLWSVSPVLFLLRLSFRGFHIGAAFARSRILINLRGEVWSPEDYTELLDTLPESSIPYETSGSWFFYTRGLFFLSFSLSSFRLLFFSSRNSRSLALCERWSCSRL